MFKWTCLAVAVVFLAWLGWLLNEVRRELHQTGQVVQTTGRTVNKHLSAIVDKTRKTTETVAEHLPEIVEKTHTTTETLAELAADIRQLKELAGLSSTARDKNLVAYADSILDRIETFAGVVGVRKTFGGPGLKNPLPAKEWVLAARKEALLLTALARSKKDLVTRLTHTKFGSPWYLQGKDQEPVALLDWLRANHPPTKELLDGASE
jgi:hypothetical protein